MKINRPFDPIEVGEIDNFCFDFTYDMGSAIIIAANYNCTLAPFQNINDPNPQNHVLLVSFPTIIAVRIPPSGDLIFKTGNFVLAQLGNFTSVSAGGTYILEGVAQLSDGRVLSLNSTVICKLPGD